MRRLFIFRKDLYMTPGKLASQVGHCAEAYWTNLIKAINWYPGNPDENKVLLHGYVDREIFDGYIMDSFRKTICEARNKNQLLKAQNMAEKLGFHLGKDYGLIYDKCLTELQSEEEDGTTLTGIWFRPLEDDVAHEISKHYHLYM